MRWIQARLSVKMVRCGGIVACCEACMRVAVMAANSARVMVLVSLFPPGLTVWMRKGVSWGWCVW